MVCSWPLRLLAALLMALGGAAAATADEAAHTNNWAVLVSTSRYWFNYRHTANALSLYHTVKAMGIPDSQILLLLPDEYACNPRNALAPSVFNVESHLLDLYPAGVEVDYRGTEVTVQSFLRLLTGRHSSDATPRSKRLLTDEGSNILIYLSGHGGDNFLKFQDNEELNSQDLRDALQQMHVQRRYRSILFMLDTCQAGTLFRELNPIDTPNVITIGSSKINQNSYSRGTDSTLGVSLVDRFTYETLHYFERNRIIQQHNDAATKTNQRTQTQRDDDTSGLSTRRTVKDLFDSYSLATLRSEVEYRSDMLHPPVVAASSSHRRSRDPAQVDPLAQLPLTDYFGAVTHIQPSRHSFPLMDEDEQRATQHNQQQSDEPRAAAATPVCGQRAGSRGCESTSRPPLSAGHVAALRRPVAFEATYTFWLLLAAGMTALLLLGKLVDGSSSAIAAV